MQNIFKKILQTKDRYNSSIVFDSRLINKNDIFIGIKSNNRDGSLFALDAIKNGAILAIVDKNKVDHKNIIFINDIPSFIIKFTKFLLSSYKGKIVAISGSVGKTTTKENIFHILNNNQIKTYRSFKNYNNIAKSRNYGITKAKYNWIAFLDSDDVWEPKKLFEVKKVLDSNFLSPSLIIHVWLKFFAILL